MSEEVKTEGDFKMKKKKPGRPRKLTEVVEDIAKVDFKKQEEEALENKQEKDNAEAEATSVEKVEVKEEEVKEEVAEAKETKEETTEEPVIMEVQEEEEKPVVKEEVKAEPTYDLPENIEKLVNFMRETGGTVEDYVRLNTNYNDLNNEQLLREYYKNTKPHLNSEEITFLMEDKFSWDDEEDSERSIKLKQLSLKEEIAKAKNFLEQTKSKYYDEIKLRPGVTQEQQKAMDFFNRYNEEQNVVKERHERFKNTTNDFFTKEFEGFDFKLGEKSFKYKVNNPNDIADKQSDLSNLVKKFLNDKGEVNDYKGYHKAIYAARNPDTLAKHFYEQGKADATKDIMAKSKNINTDTRTSPDVSIGGFKVRAISGDDSSKLRIKKYKQ